MKIFTAASMLASVLCLPEPEAGLGVEDMVTLSRSLFIVIAYPVSGMQLLSG